MLFTKRLIQITIYRFQHENIKMMLDTINIRNLMKNSENTTENYKDCLRMIACKNPAQRYYFNVCDDCPEAKDLCDRILRDLVDATITHVKYAHWTSTDRATLLKPLYLKEEASSFHLCPNASLEMK